MLAQLSVVHQLTGDYRSGYTAICDATIVLLIYAVKWVFISESVDQILSLFLFSVIQSSGSFLNLFSLFCRELCIPEIDKYSNLLTKQYLLFWKVLSSVEKTRSEIFFHCSFDEDVLHISAILLENHCGMHSKTFPQQQIARAVWSF